MKHIYLASPYTHDNIYVVEDRVNQVCLVASQLMNRGLPIFSPIAHCHPIAMAGALPTNWEFWQHYDEVMMRGASALWVLQLDGWIDSNGIKNEIKIARQLALPVQFGVKAEHFVF